MADTLEREREARRRADQRPGSRSPDSDRDPARESRGARRQVAQPTPQRLASLHEEVLRLGALVEDLDALAHADAPVAVIDREPVDLEALARAQVEALRPRLDAKALQARAAILARDRPGRPGAAWSGLANLLEQRDEVHARGRPNQGFSWTRPTAPHGSPSLTAARASPPTSKDACSSGSGAVTQHAEPPGVGSGSP